MHMISTLLAAALTLTPGTTEIVVDKAAPKATLIAANEMQGLLGKVLGDEVPIVREPTAGLASIMLGTNGWSAAAGLHPETLRRDGFRIRVKDGRIYIAGCDSTLPDPENVNFLGEECLWQPQFERGTLFGVYAFLERFAGCRFYFPGELGTILPRKASLVIPEADITEEPDFTVRRYGYQDGEVAPEMLGGLTEREFKRLNFYRLRGETEYIPCCHGQNKLFIPQRFPDHPEYRQLDSDGKRCPPGRRKRTPHLQHQPALPKLHLGGDLQGRQKLLLRRTGFCPQDSGARRQRLRLGTQRQRAEISRRDAA